MLITESFEMYSSSVGDRFLVQVALPVSYSGGDQRYPLVYSLDAHTMFGTASEAAWLMTRDLIRPGYPEVLLVGIGYPDPLMGSLLRVRDLTPVGSVPPYFEKTYIEQYGVAAQSGGADNYLRFIQEELNPVIQERYRTTGDTAGILGASFGGLFTFYAFLKRAKLFDRFWMGSPGVFDIGEQYLDELPKVLERGIERETRVYLSLGALEETADFEPYKLLSKSYHRMVKTFDQYPQDSLTVKADRFDDETHTSVLGLAMTRSLRFLYPPS